MLFVTNHGLLNSKTHALFRPWTVKLLSDLESKSIFQFSLNISTIQCE